MKPLLPNPRSPLPAEPSQFRAQPHGGARPTPHASGVALVVTLIMLSVITFMAIALLVLSRAEHGSVATETEQTQARLAAEYGLQRAIAQALAPMMTQTNEFRYDLLVSTNYINPFGFTNGGSSPLNVNYDMDSTPAHNPLTDAQRAQNITNLWYDPRPPVYVTNRLAGGYEFRFFHNLNRNTNIFGPIFDPTGWLVVSNSGVPVSTNWFVGDPQWVGVLSSPDRPHAADNRFVSRYAYLAIPASKALDLNYIHNQASRPEKTLLHANGDDYLRNQGVGSWEINLGAFLCDLNTNRWTYQYDPFASGGGLLPGGSAFMDACSLIRYRYGCTNNDLTINTAKLPSFSNLYPNGEMAFTNDAIDGYTAGPIWPVMAGDLDSTSPSRIVRPWPGANNTNHYFTPQELFDTNKTSVSFVNQLMIAGNTPNSPYDQYTFYRMLAQLGSDSAGDGGRINLNYCNLDNQGNVVPNMETNFAPWIPEQFFTNTANALLRTYGYNFTVTNIQIYPTNFYTPNVHRLLQLAANIYDAGTGTNASGATNLPTVFRPLFRRTGDGRILIAGYREAQDDTNAVFAVGGPSPIILGYNEGNIPLYDQTQPFAPNDTAEPLVVGIPLVIGAKKGMPNFNEFGMQTTASIGRKLRFSRQAGSSDGAIVSTNQMFLLTLTNTFGFEAWNSYLTTYPRPLELRMDAIIYASLTNATSTNNLLRAPSGAGDLTDPIATHIYRPIAATIPANKWPGYGLNDNSAQSFKAVTQSFLWTNAQYNSVVQTLLPLPGMWEALANSIQGTNSGLYLSLRSLIRFALVDTQVSPHRIIDYVSLDATSGPTNLIALLKEGGQCGNTAQPNPIPSGSMWCDNPGFGGVAEGILNQITVNLGLAECSQWPSKDHTVDIDFFRYQFGLGMLTYSDGTFSKTNTFHTGFGAERNITFYTRWQANDPLVHYTMPDLLDPFAGKPGIELDTTDDSSMVELGGYNPFTGVAVGSTTPLNSHYRPWGGSPKNTAETAPTSSNWRLELKDPLVARSDAWNFPTNKYPNVGWLGRVHRGTPWQTVYLKSPTNDWTRWTAWTGNDVVVTNFDGRGSIRADALFSLPENDRSLLDLFSTAFSDTAARGRMSINQENLAAWSAILSGVVVLTNTTSEAALKPVSLQQAPLTVKQMPQVIQPACLADPVARIVNSINTTRTNYFSNHTFNRLGDLLAVPELTVASPFLNQSGTKNPGVTGKDYGLTYQQTKGLTDEMYERIPQQILGLLQCDHTPRFVIYAYGQALKPAEHSLVLGGQYFQLCTNYQITAEVATRAVVRIDGAPSNPRAVIESFNVLPPD